MKSLTSFLVHKGAVSARVLQEVLLNQTIRGGDIGINLLEMKALSEMNLVQLTGQFHRLLVVSLQDLVAVPREVTGLITRDLAARIRAVPFDVEEGNIYIACFQPPVKKDEMVIRNLTGKIPRFFIASPLSTSIALWIHYGVEFSQRMARIIGRINSEEHALIDNIIDKVEEERRAHLMAIVERRWEVFPVIDEKRETLVEFVEEEEEGGDKEDKWGEEGESDEEIFNKYIVINRIGAKPRRPTGVYLKTPAIETSARPLQEPPQKEEDAPEPPVQSRDAAEIGRAAVIDTAGLEIRPGIHGYPIPVMGMLTTAEVLAKIENAAGAGEVIDTIHDYAMQFFEFVMVLRYRKGRFELSLASSKEWGFKAEEISIRHLYSAQLPESLIKLARPCNFTVTEDNPLMKMLAECGRGAPRGSILVPLNVQNRVVAVLYGDNGEAETKLDDLKDLFHAAWMASNKLLSFIIEKKK
jgi:hypothetical protein